MQILGHKFGYDQRKKPTPGKVNDLFDFLAAVFGIIASFVTTAAFVSHTVSDVLSPVLTGLFIPILLAAKRFVGSSTTDKDIPVGDVKVIEEEVSQIPKRD